MADESHQYGEGTINTTKNAGIHIDALEVESGKNIKANVNNGDITRSLTFNQASSISFIISLLLYLWYMVPAMGIFAREIFIINQYKMLYEDQWNDDDFYTTYITLFLIASVAFIISTLIQIYVWFAKRFVYILCC